MLSPDTVSQRPSDSAPVEAALNFMDKREAGTQFILRDASKQDNEIVMAYRDEHNIKVKVMTSGKDLIIQYPSKVHERSAVHFNDIIGEYNNGLSGSRDFPMVRNLTASVNLMRGGNLQPDAQIQVLERGHNSPNAVMECHYLHGGTSPAALTAFYNNLIMYFVETDDVMVVMGVKVYPRLLDNSFAALVISLHRTGPQACVLTKLTSFGTGPFSEAQIEFWNNLTNSQVDGFGIGVSPPCDLHNSLHPLYLMDLQVTHMLSLNNEGTQLANGLHPNNLAPVQFSLYALQRSIQLGFLLM